MFEVSGPYFALPFHFLLKRRIKYNFIRLAKYPASATYSDVLINLLRLIGFPVPYLRNPVHIQITWQNVWYKYNR